MVTNRSRAYPRRSGKKQTRVCEDVDLEISVFGFEGITTFKRGNYIKVVPR